MIAALKADDHRNIDSALHTAAQLTKVCIENLRPTLHLKHAFSFVLRPDRQYFESGRCKFTGKFIVRAPYTRMNHRLTRSVHAVCWHGHRDFFRAVFKFIPDLKIITAVATYKGLRHFESTFEPTGDKNIGSQMEPCSMRDACYCDGLQWWETDGDDL